MQYDNVQWTMYNVIMYNVQCNNAQFNNVQCNNVQCKNVKYTYTINNIILLCNVQSSNV